MRAGARLWLGAGLFNLAHDVYAAPSVNVALQASFDAPPYLVELLETAAEENATAYFPLLNCIADGHFDDATTDQDLYTRFRALLQDEGHLSRSEDLASFDFALAIRSTAPRIESHFQYYNTFVQQPEEEGCETWVHVPFVGQRYCSPELNEGSAQAMGKPSTYLRVLPFDRVLGDASSPRPAIMYADITSRSFRAFYTTLKKTASDGKTSLIVRYKSPTTVSKQSLTVSGYGVELALKRTDYIVIDDRQAEQKSEGSVTSAETTLNESGMSDLRPLSASELRGLGMKAASFVQNSDAPFDTLKILLQDFPRHSAVIANTNISEAFVQEHLANRQVLLPSGYNMLWINGVQIMPRDFDAYSLLEYLRKERKMIRSLLDLGLSATGAIDLLAHEVIAASQTGQEAQRYDWRDENEGGNVIIWLNDIEKDKRYAEWLGGVRALLQRTYPGQLPSVRRNLHNLVIPIDFASFTDVELIVDGIQGYVKRKVPIRFGLVPTGTSSDSVAQAKVVLHLLESYGLAAALSYLEHSVTGAGRKYGAPQEKCFTQASDGRQLRKGRTVLSFDDILSDEEISTRLHATTSYLGRLGQTAASPSILINGVPIAKTEDWLQSMSQRINQDIRVMQEAVYRGQVTDDDYLPDLFLATASLRRNTLIFPEDENAVKHLDLEKLPEIADIPSLPSTEDTIERELVHLTVVDDFDTLEGFSHLLEALLFKKQHDNVELGLLHFRSNATCSRRQVQDYKNMQSTELMQTLLHKFEDAANRIARNGDDKVNPDEFRPLRRQAIIKEIYDSFPEALADSGISWSSFEKVVKVAGPKAVILNGRLVGPIPLGAELTLDDFDSLLSYERKKRLLPAALAIEALNLAEKASTPFAFARISNLIARSQVNDIPEGIFEAASTKRTNDFKNWATEYTTIKIGHAEEASIQIYASIDPASETAQRWLPIISTLSELAGVHICIFLNPQERLEELPIKRFYRHVLAARPTFTSDGALNELSANFTGLPADALLNMGMDLPPSWLVAPRDSVHDLDNIKLSAVKTGQDIKAIYELEHILIEGHSRDITIGPPPRGAQLVLGTQVEPHFADTIIMANLGYFQFKANPGVYNLTLQNGRSEEIFSIDSVGSDYNTPAGDAVNDVTLMSFRGVTLYPRLSRKAGMEDEDVLEASKSGLESLADGADRLLAQAGLHDTEASRLINRAAKFGYSLLSSLGGKATASDQHAEINIFSVASGHLYERMLNIMMLSVMKHTKHTVKFWFIEQFLSPSFKDFLPVMADEYGFRYEMVTYKWPHWLRAQKEKQREIWGYKILFLDVLFPLDLDKVIFVDADQIVRTDMYELVQHDLQGAPYGFTPMCDSRTEMEGFRFWKQGYWKNFLRGLPYHISALYVVDLKKFRQIAAGDRLRQQYHQLSADPASLSNLDQDLPNHMQMALPIHSLPQEWLWCETWCSDEALKDAKTIDLCNNPQTKEPKLDRARRQVPEWTVYDDEIAAVAMRYKMTAGKLKPVAGKAGDAGVQGEAEESIQEKLQREDAEREKKKDHVRDEL